MASSSGAEPAGQLAVGLAEQLRNAPNWEEVVTFAVAWAYLDHVAIHFGDGKFRMDAKLALATFKCSFELRMSFCPLILVSNDAEDRAPQH